LDGIQYFFSLYEQNQKTVKYFEVIADPTVELWQSRDVDSYLRQITKKYISIEDLRGQCQKIFEIRLRESEISTDRLCSFCTFPLREWPICVETLL
jgi:hypothetical protein